MAFGLLQPAQDPSVRVHNARQFLDAHGPVEGIVRVQAVGVRLFARVEPDLVELLRVQLAVLQIDLEHLFEEDSVLVLYFTHAFYRQGRS